MFKAAIIFFIEYHQYARCSMQIILLFSERRSVYGGCCIDIFYIVIWLIETA